MNVVDPYSIETRYTLDMMCMLLHAQAPRSVRIASDSPEMVKAVIRRIADDYKRIIVDTPDLSEEVQNSLNISVEIASQQSADAILCPLSFRPQLLPHERVLVGAFYNAWSYKTLLQPGKMRMAAARVIQRVRDHYRVDTIRGLYSPRFITLLGLSEAARRWNPRAHFQLGDRAMQYLYEDGPLWRLSYVVVFAGHR